MKKGGKDAIDLYTLEIVASLSLEAMPLKISLNGNIQDLPIPEYHKCK